MSDNIGILSLITEADLVVQSVMGILVVMSIYSWAIILSKKKILIDSKSDIKNFFKYFSIDKTPNELKTQLPYTGAMVDIFIAGYGEFTRSITGNNQANSERAYRLMNTAANDEVDRLDKGLSILAMIASSSPYIGLFGTVWGIMHSFIGLASVKQASIAVVAPGIAEALIATAFGLFAAIPATIAYNRLTSEVGEIDNQYRAFTEKMLVVFQRQK